MVLQKSARAVPALERGLAILETVAEDDGGRSFGELVKRLSLPTSSAARILGVLVERGYLARDEASGAYRIGAGLSALALGQPFVEVLRREALPVVRSLCSATGNTALFVHWNGRTLQCLAKAMDEGAIAMQQVGDVRSDVLRYPWSPFVYEALSPASRARALGESAKATDRRNAGDRTIDAAALEKQLRFFDKHGYVRDDGHAIRRLGAPVRAADGTLAGALGLGGTVQSLPADRVEQAAAHLVAHADCLSRAIGWRPTRDTGDAT